MNKDLDWRAAQAMVDAAAKKKKKPLLTAATKTKKAACPASVHSLLTNSLSKVTRSLELFAREVTPHFKK